MKHSVTAMVLPFLMMAAGTQAQDMDTLVIPSGAWLTIRTDQPLSTKRNQPGDFFSATLLQPVIANGRVVARRGQTIAGRITNLTPAGRTKGTAQMTIELNELALADGQQVPVRTQLLEFEAGSSRGKDTAIIAAASGAGAAVGAAAAGGAGAGIGAAAGAGAAAGVLFSRGKAVEIPVESVMRFRLMEPVTVNQAKSQQAFVPVQQSDFETRPLQPRAPATQQTVVMGGPGWGWGPGWGMWGDPWLMGPGWGWGGGWVGGGWGGRGWGGGVRGGGMRGGGRR